MYHYEFTFASFIILLLLSILSLSRNYMPTRRNFFFRCLLASEFVTLIFDVLSSEMDMCHGLFSPGILYLNNMLFFLGFVWRSFLDFSYVEALVSERCSCRGLPHWLSRLPVLILTVVILSSIVTGAIFSIDAAGYHSGSAYMLIYWHAYLYLVFMLYMSVIGLQQETWTKIEKASLLGACFILMIGYLVRMHAQPYLVMNSFYMLVILIQYFAFQNPDFSLDRKTGALNQDAAASYIKELDSRGDFSLFALVLNDYAESRTLYGESQMTAGIQAITEYLKLFHPDCQIAYTAAGRFLMLTPAPMNFRRIREELDQRMLSPWHGPHLHLYLTSSYATFRGSLPPQTSARHFLDYTAAALQQAERHHEVVSMHAELFAAADRATSIRQAVDRAIEQDTIQIYLQPLYGTKEKRIIGAEVLARLHDEQLGFIPPDVFIRTAEHSGTITQLGEQIFAKACRFAASNELQKLGLKNLNINLSPIQCRDSQMANRLCRIAAQYGVPIRTFKFEITESTLVYEIRLRQNIKKLMDEGAVFSLDDFGTGYSNLMRIAKFPFSDIKLDMSFVRMYCQTGKPLLPAMVASFQAEGKETTAEGIETEEMAKSLTSLGCDILQGYYFSRPLPEQEFLSYLQEQKP